MKKVSAVLLIVLIVLVIALASCNLIRPAPAEPGFIPVTGPTLAPAVATDTPMDTSTPAATDTPVDVFNFGTPLPTECVLFTSQLRLPIQPGCAIKLGGSSITISTSATNSYNCTLTGVQGSFTVSNGQPKSFTLSNGNASLTCNGITYRVNQ